MKKLLIVFGILDVVTLIKDFKDPVDTGFTSASPYFLAVIIGTLLIYLSLILSAYFLIRQSKVGLWLTYAQFPLRLFFVVLSFGFLLSVNPFQMDEIGYKYFIGVLMGLEIVRLIITIQIHRKYFGQKVIQTLR
jgi:hypothetical protein